MRHQVHPEHGRGVCGETMDELIAVPELTAQGTKPILVLSPGLGEVGVPIRVSHELASSLYNLEVENINKSLKQLSCQKMNVKQTSE